MNFYVRDIEPDYDIDDPEYDEIIEDLEDDYDVVEDEEGLDMTPTLNDLGMSFRDFM